MVYREEVKGRNLTGSTQNMRRNKDNDKNTTDPRNSI